MFLFLLLLFALLGVAGSTYTEMIQLQRVVLVPAFYQNTNHTMGCGDLHILEVCLPSLRIRLQFCGVNLDFYCSGLVSNANLSTSMEIFVTVGHITPRYILFLG